MQDKKLLQRHRALLEQLSRAPMPAGAARAEAERALHARHRGYALDMPLGRALYASYSDGELAGLLRERGRALGHAPAQHEVFLFYRTYLKRRFGTWPAALRAAGLSRDRREEAQILEDWGALWWEEPTVCRDLISLAERWESLGYPPTQKELGEPAARLKERFGPWSAVLSASEQLLQWLDGREPPPAGARPAGELEQLRTIAARLGRTPLRAEVPEQARCALRFHWGSWSAALRAAGFAPLSPEQEALAQADYQCRRRAGSGVLERLEALSPADLELLEQLRALCRRLGRAPLKEEAPEPLRAALIARCGSWRNALYQIGVAALTRQEAAQVKLEARRAARRAQGRGY